MMDPMEADQDPIWIDEAVHDFITKKGPQLLQLSSIEKWLFHVFLFHEKTSKAQLG